MVEKLVVCVVVILFTRGFTVIIRSQIGISHVAWRKVSIRFQTDSPFLFIVNNLVCLLKLSENLNPNMTSYFFSSQNHVQRQFFF